MSLRTVNATGRLFGLRTRTVQLLFHRHPPFRQRVGTSPSVPGTSRLSYQRHLQVSTSSGVQLGPGALARLALARLHSVWTAADSSGPAPNALPAHPRAFYFKLLLRDHKPREVREGR